METVCLKCGDRGFQVALVFCTGCKAYALHRYCLKGPVIFTDPVTWFCEDCATKLGVPPSLDQSTPLSSVRRDSVNLESNVIQAKRELINCIMRVKKCNKQHKKKIKKKQKKVKINSALVDKTKVVLSGSHISPELEHPRCSFSSEEECEAKNECGLALRHVCEEENKVKNECESAPRDVANSDVGEEESVVKRKCGAAPRDVGFQSVPISQGATYNDSSCVELHGHVYAQPIINPIWRGSMYFCNETVGTVCGLLAHMSDVACSRVLEEAGHFPEMLHVELLPRSMVWPESFKGGEPTDQDIALFFFPDSEGAEKVFDALVDDIISHEHAIRFVAKNAELLIFPSTELPISYWRFEAKYYLWGVFKRKQTSKETNDAVCRD